MSETDQQISWTSKWIRGYVNWLTHWYWLILLLAIALSYFSFHTAKKLSLDTDLVALMPDGVPSVENLQRVISKTGGYSHAMVVVESPDGEAAVEFLDQLRQEIMKLESVVSAEYAEDTSIFERNQLLYVEAEDLQVIHQRLRDRIEYEQRNIRFDIDDETSVVINIRGEEAQPPSLDFSDIEEKYRGKGGKQRKEKRKIFRNDAGDITILVVLPEGRTTSMKYSRQIIKDLRVAIAKINPQRFHPQMTAIVGGRVLNRVAEFDVVISDLRSSAFWSIGSILLIIVLFYRRLMAVIYIGLPLTVAFLWTFAITELVLGGLNLITVFLILILFGLGIDFGIHNLQRYDEVRRKQGSMVDGLLTIVSKTGHASLLAGVTTTIGFYALMTTDFRAFSEFGFVAGTGVTLALVSMYIVFPSLLVLAEKTRIYRLPFNASISKVVGEGPFPGAKLILLLGLAATVISIFMALKVEFETDVGKLDTRIEDVNAIKRKIRQVFPLRSDRAVVYVETLQEVSGLVEEIERIRTSRTPEEATIEKVKSIYSVVPSGEDQQERLEIIDQIHQQISLAIRLLEDFGKSEEDQSRKQELESLVKYAGVSELKPQDLPESVQRVYTGVEGSQGYLVYIYNTRATSDFEFAQAFVNDIREIKVGDKIYYPATDSMVFVDMLNLMKKDARNAVIAVMVAVFMMLLLAYRNIKRAVIVMVPVLIGILWMLGIMAYFKIPLNVVNMVVLPAVLGIGIDNAIHIFQRYREEGYARVREVMTTTGGAAFLTTATTTLGFAGTLSASNEGLKSLGLVACIGLGACLVTSLTVFPALLEYLTNGAKEKGQPQAG